MRQLKITKSITNRESQSLEKYLQEIGKVELISPEEEVRLARLIKQGDQRAPSVLMKPKVSNSFLMLYGGSASLFFRLWQNRQGSFVCH
jgi:hypothetical protein